MADRARKQRGNSKHGNPNGGWKIPPKRSCKMCGTAFLARYGMNFYCSRKCRLRNKRERYWKPLNVDFGCAIAGSICEHLAICAFSLEHWHVFRAVNPTGPFDLVVFKNGATHRVEVKKGKINYDETRVQYNKGFKVGEPTYKERGADWTAIVVMESRQVFVFRSKRNYYRIADEVPWKAGKKVKPIPKKPERRMSERSARELVMKFYPRAVCGVAAYRSRKAVSYVVREFKSSHFFKVPVLGTAEKTETAAWLSAVDTLVKKGLVSPNHPKEGLVQIDVNDNVQK